MPFRIVLGIAVFVMISSCVPVVEDLPSNTIVIVPTSTIEPEEEMIPSFQFKDPTVPQTRPGTGLPKPINTESDEIDCDEAEYNLCDSGEWSCDDIADYCDVGPDNDRGLPEDWDWDQ